ncbi:hypothetical protein [Gilliamella apis]|nr:hypothetical protein [Gilliamella apis]
MMRIIIASLLMFLLVSCTHERTSQNAYAEGNYLESINLLAAKIEEKSEANFKQTDAEKLSKLVNDVMNKYEDELASTTNTDYKKRIEIYEKLLEMNKRLTNRFYSTELVNVLDKYPAESLRQNIAKDLYDQGVNFETQNDYKAAAEAFSQASSVYQPLGKYKDSDKRAYNNGKKQATLMAEEAYQQAKMLSEIAMQRLEFRQVAKYYEQAVDAYRHYGRYKDATSLANTYKRKGIIKVYCYASEYCSEVKLLLNKDYVTFVSSPVGADLKIKITVDKEYNSTRSQIDIPNTRKVFDKYIEHIDAQGNRIQIPTLKDETYYTKLDTNNNSLSLETVVRMEGIIDFSDTIYARASSYYENDDDLLPVAKRELITKLRSLLESTAQDLCSL